MPDACCSVLMTTDAVGGVWTFSIGLAHELVRHGLHVTLVVIGPPPSHEQRERAQAINNLTLLECSGDLEWMDDPWIGVARSGQYLLAVARQTAPQIVHLGSYAHATLAFDCPKLVTAHSCVLSWWEAVKGESAPTRYNEYRRVVMRGLRSADEVVAPTTAMLSALKRIYGISAGVVIPNGSAPVDRRTAARELFVLCVGRVWDEAKNLRALAAVAPALSVPVYVAGPGSEQLQNVIALGPLDSGALAHWFEKAAIYAAPAYYEPFGLGVLEAAAHGAALVLSNIESLREIWADAAIYVAPDDIVSLRDAIESLAQDTGLRQTMAERAYRRARTYSVRRQACRYFRLYRDLLSRTRVTKELPRQPVSHLGNGRWEPCGL